MSGYKNKRQEMPLRPPEERIRDFEEVPTGFTEQQALAEAERCLQCKNPLCVKGCPVSIDIPSFIKLILEEKYIEAAEKIKEDNLLPAVCGRVCPQEDQCEFACILSKTDQKPVAIGALERFVADYARDHQDEKKISIGEPTGFNVAVVGSGPAGLTAAADLLKYGHNVTIFEAFHQLGGVLAYGIPEFRLPKDIVSDEIKLLEEMGARIELNTFVGKTVGIDELLNEKGFDAVFIGSGAGLPRFMGIPGENLAGVYSANEFLSRISLMRAHREDYVTPVKVGEKVVVVGGGNVALDAARSARRIDNPEVRLVYRRSREQMPARAEEIEHAEQEGIIFDFLTNPVRYIGDELGRVKAVECVDMQLGEPDESGRRRPLEIEGSEHIIETDTVVVAIGSRPRGQLAKSTEGLETTEWGTLKVDEETGQTTRDEVFAAGDVVTGAATVIQAMGAARRAAAGINEYLETRQNISSGS
jgi:glutamate synthase (NADPH/NADH) small chain